MPLLEERPPGTHRLRRVDRLEVEPGEDEVEPGHERTVREAARRQPVAHELGDGEVHPVEGAHAVTIGQRRLHLVHPRDERVD